jgi:hypothetical protein
VHTHFGRPTVPGSSRGIIPLLVAALGAGALRAGIGAITGNQRKQRNKGYINDAYRRSSQELDTRQRGARQSLAESANARGLAQGGDISASPIHTAMRAGLMKASGSPSTIGGQVASDANVQMGLERQDLDQQHDRALKENKAEYVDTLLGSAASGVQTGMNVYGAGKDLGAGGGGVTGAPPVDGTPNLDIGAAPTDAAYTPSARLPKLDRNAIHASMLSATSYDGVHPNDPLGETTSAWSTHPPQQNRLAVPGEANASFNAG